MTAWRVALCVASLAMAGCDGGPLHLEAGRLPGGPPPDDVARGLSTDARVLDCPGGVVEGRSAFDAGWVVAHAVDLDGDGRDDWLVEGRHPCLSGEGGADWWVYAGDEAGARLLAAAGRARTVDVLPRRDGGFSDLRLAHDPAGPTLLRYVDGAYAPVAAPPD